MRQLNVLGKSGATQQASDVSQLKLLSCCDLWSNSVVTFFNFSIRYARNLRSLPALATYYSEVWESASKIARAFQIGKNESQAIHNLMEKTPASIVNKLKAAVQVRGMRGFLNHETIAKDVFCLAWSSGTGPLQAWNEQLTNVQDAELVFRLRLERCFCDWLVRM